MEVKLDKLSLTCSLTNGQFANVLSNFAAAKDEGAKVWSSSKHAFTDCSITLSDAGKLHLRVGSSHGKLYLKQSLNPTKLSKAGLSDLVCWQETLFNFGYEELYATARVQYIELAVDVPDVALQDIVVIDSSVKSYNEMYSAKGTLYLGSLKSSRQVIVYDKGKQLHEVEGQPLSVQLMRIEAALKPKATPLNKMGDAMNPFASILVAGRVAVTEHNAATLGWSIFRAAIAKDVCGQRVYCDLLPEMRKSVVLTLTPLTPSWWSADMAWQNAKLCLEALQPEQIKKAIS